MKRVFSIAGMVCLVLGGLVYGMAAGAYKLPPFPQFKAAKDLILGEEEDARPYNSRAAQYARFAPDIDVVMVGDSLTEMGMWEDFFPGVSLANRGIGNETTGQIRRRLDAIIATRSERAFVMAGINDVTRGMPQAKTLDNYRTIVRSLRAAGAEVIVQSTIHAGAAGRILGGFGRSTANCAKWRKTRGRASSISTPRWRTRMDCGRPTPSMERT